MKNFLRTVSLAMVFALVVQIMPTSVIADTVRETATEITTASAENQIIGECKEYRDKYTKVFERTDGIYTAVVSASPIHFEENNAWKDIDNSLAESMVDGKAVLKNTDNSFTVTLPKSISESNKTVKVEKDGYALSFVIEDVKTSLFHSHIDAETEKAVAERSVSEVQKAANLEKKSSKVEYKSIQSGVDYEYTVLPDSVKENIVLGSKPDKNTRFSFTVSAPGMTAKLLPDNSIEFYDNESTAVFTLPAPFMYDQNNIYSEDINVNFEKNKDGSFTLTYAPSTDWLSDSSRSYPVVIDPIVRLDSEDEIYDTFVSNASGKQNVNYGSYTYATVGNKSDGSYWAYFKPQASLWASKAVVTDATLKVYAKSETAQPMTIAASVVTGNWAESTTYSTRPSNETLPIDCATATASSYTQISFDITQALPRNQDNLGGATYPMGVMLSAYDTATNSANIYTSEYTNAQYVPVIEYSFVETTGQSDKYEYHTQNIGRAGTVSVNDFTGGMYLVRDEIGIDGNIMPVNIQQYYSTASADLCRNAVSPYFYFNFENYGRVWLTNYHRYIGYIEDYYVDANGNGIDVYFYIDGTGTITYFEKDDTVTSYPEKWTEQFDKTSTGKGLTMWVPESIAVANDGTNYEGIVVEESSGQKMTFEELGRMVSITAAPDSHITDPLPTIQVDFKGSQYPYYEIDKITDGVGREYRFTYDTSANLTSIQAFDAQNTGITVGSGTSATNLQMTYTYNGVGKLTTATYPDGESVTYSYVSNSGFAPRIQSVTDINGYRLSYNYNNRNAVTQITESTLDSSLTRVTGNVVDISYDSPYQRTYEDSYGNTEVAQFDNYGRKIGTYNDEGQYLRNTYEDTVINNKTYNLSSGSAYIEEQEDNIVINGNMSALTDNFPNSWTGTNLTATDIGATEIKFDETVNVMQITGNPNAEKAVSQTISITGGEGDTVDIGCWAKAKAGINSGTAAFRMRMVYTYTDENNQTAVKTETVDFIPFVDYWQYVAASFTLLGACSQITIYLDYSNQINTAYYTDVRAVYTDVNTSGTGASSQNEPTYCVCGEDCACGLGCDCECASKAACTCLKCHETTTDTYDSLGNITSTTVNNGSMELATGSGYSTDKNYLTSATNSAGNVVDYNYNLANGTLTSVTDSLDNPVGYTYNAMRALASVSQEVSGLSTGTTYNYEDDRLDTIAVGNGVDYSFEYDLWGNLTGVNVGTQSLADYTYGTGENRSRISSLTYGNGQTITYRYDSQNNVTGISYNGGTTYSYTYTYSSTGGLTSATDNINHQIINYADDGYEIHTIPEQGQTAVLLYASSYDEDGNFVQTANGYTYTFAECEAETQQQKDDEAEASRTTGQTFKHSTISSTVTSLTLSSSTDFFGRPSNSSLMVKDGTNTLGTVAVDYAYQSGTGSQTTEFVSSYKNIVTPTTGSATNVEYTYTYDNNGNISTISFGTVLKYTYHYDEACQLTRVDDAVQNKTFVYVYNNGGNITAKKEYAYSLGTLGTPETTNYTYGSSTWEDKLTAYGGLPLTYDAIGNLTAFDGKTYTWTAGRQLAELGISALQYTIDYKYNADGLRTQKIINDNENYTTTTYDYVWADGQLVSQTDGTDVLYFIYDENDSPVGFTVNDAETYLYIKNLQGDITGIVDENGAIIVNYTYDAWGKLLSTTDASGTPITDTNNIAHINPLRYRGYYYDDEVGMYYLQSRYYHPVLCRFINADDFNVLEETIGEMFVANLMNYCDSNVVNRSDPSGNWGADIHYGKDGRDRWGFKKGEWYRGTYGWAFEVVGFKDTRAAQLAKADNKTDQEIATDFIGIGQEYHFDRRLHLNTTIDTRLDLAYSHLHNAADLWLSKKYDKAMKELGQGLHAYQDIEAHGDFGIDIDGHLGLKNKHGENYDDPEYYWSNGSLITDNEVDDFLGDRYWKTKDKTIVYLMVFLDLAHLANKADNIESYIYDFVLLEDITDDYIAQIS